MHERLQIQFKAIVDRRVSPPVSKSSRFVFFFFWAMHALSLYVYLSLSTLYIFLCCSKKTIVAIVCGPRRTKLGTQPLNIQNNPSFQYAFRSASRIPTLRPADI